MASRSSEPLALNTDVLVIGGGPAGAWAAWTAAAAGRKVVLVDKGYFGTSGATAPSNTGRWCVPPGPGRGAAAARRAARAGGLADPAEGERVLGAAYDGLLWLAEQGYPFPRDESGQPYIANLRGPDFMRFMRREVKAAGVTVLDHHPALSLLADGQGIAGARGLARQQGRAWRITAGAVVLATGGCAYGERMLGATGLTGDGYLMAAEAGATLSGMEFCSQYGIAPAGTSLNKGLIYRWATFTDSDGRALDPTPSDRHAQVARALLDGPVYACLDLADDTVQGWLRRAQPNCFVPFDKQGIDPFTQRFAVTLRCEGTVRGVGGIRLANAHGATDIPGLFAAGDAASREALTGAISGGGGPNASWAIASGKGAGTGAALHAARLGSLTATRQVRDVAGLTPGTPAMSAGAAADVVAAVRQDMLPLDTNFFRHSATLGRMATRLEGAWQATRHDAGGDADLLRSREATALLASARWSVASARLRKESRGMHRLQNAAFSDPGQARRILLRGVDRIDVAYETEPEMALS
ncbi:FAD-dependent oxidoreductase [Pigmentiphaga litoralis]|uniref:Succinate dehydrogenase/fumarate reductase flavoprotein subunit n=1 Tax=Pigmentiphaga litoralis TaxID=516702 RepID=A0A7Y9LNT9_9BURK|nr:FAD-binding protein [Pigmentiphaga litoralis]NYE22730.1 succinate dehydrogenase/fumarate reductase flavoprotein subunit [Pigmentiphaga litoralis]NYE83655.1 succinate dehydrogenase/fumarate reductase flavoprotein subunit [Pigmentiphaga litoralis]